MANVSEIGGYIRLVSGDKDVAELVSKDDQAKISSLLGKALSRDNYYGIYVDDFPDVWADDMWGSNVDVYGNGRWSCYSTMYHYFESDWGALNDKESKELAKLFKKYNLELVFHYTDVEQGMDFTDSGVITISVSDNNTTYQDKVDTENYNFTYKQKDI